MSDNTRQNPLNCKTCIGLSHLTGAGLHLKSLQSIRIGRAENISKSDSYRKHAVDVQ